MVSKMENPITTSPRRRGRPRIHSSAAEKQRAYRSRKRLRRERREESRKFSRTPELSFLMEQLRNSTDTEVRLVLFEQIEYWEQIDRQKVREKREQKRTLRYLIAGLEYDRKWGGNTPWYVRDAPHGLGLLTVLPEEAVERVDGNHQHDMGKVSPKGSSPDDEAEWMGLETEDLWMKRQKFPMEWELSEEQKAAPVTQVKKPICVCGRPASKIKNSRLLCDACEFRNVTPFKYPEKSGNPNDNSAAPIMQDTCVSACCPAAA